MEQIINTPIIGEVEQSFLDYSLSVITDRAIPSAEDGLKPVARRILWDMFDKGYMNNKKFVKIDIKKKKKERNFYEKEIDVTRV